MESERIHLALAAVAALGGLLIAIGVRLWPPRTWEPPAFRHGEWSEGRMWQSKRESPKYVACSSVG